MGLLLIFTIGEKYVIDRIGIQVLVLSIFNTLGFFYFTFLKPKSIYIFKKNELIPTLIFLLLLLNLISITFAFNKVEALIAFNKYFQFFISFFVISFCLSEMKYKNKFFIYAIVLVSSLENIYSFYSIINYYFDMGYISRTYLIKGFSGNINITAFSIAYKIPILLHLIFSNKRFTYIGLLLVSLSIFNILSYGTRGAYVCLAIIFLAHFSYRVYLKDFFTKKFSLTTLIIVLSFIVSTSFLNTSGNNVFERASSISINTVDGSVNQRLRFYNQIINKFISNPFEIIGVGNYKIMSIEYDKDDIRQYIIPYNAHNDFLEILLEIGFFGFLIYAIIFLKAFQICARQIMFYGNTMFFYIALFFITYGIDSSLNFPYSRLISFVFFLFVLSFSTLIDKHEIK